MNNIDKRMNYNTNYKKKINKKLILLIVFLISIFFLALIIPKIIKLIVEPTKTFTLYNDQIVDDEKAEAIIFRKEEVIPNLKKHKINKIKKDAQRVATNEEMFRYYTIKDDKLLKEKEQIDNDINKEIKKNNLSLDKNSDYIIDQQIANIIMGTRYETNLSKLEESKKNIERLLFKKIENIPDLSQNTRYQELKNRKKQIEQELKNDDLSIKAKESGMVSYRVDGYEEVFNNIELENINKDVLSKIKTKKNIKIEETKDRAKLVSGYATYLAIAIPKEKIKKAKEGQEIYIKFGENAPFSAIIDKIILGKSNIIIVKTIEQQEKLLKYRKIDVYIIWKQNEGYKVINSSIYTKNGISYILRENRGYTTEIPIVVTYKSKRFSLVRNMTKNEYKKYKIEKDDLQKIREYDEIVLNPNKSKDK